MAGVDAVLPSGAVFAGGVEFLQAGDHAVVLQDLGDREQSSGVHVGCNDRHASPSGAAVAEFERAFQCHIGA